MRSIKTPEGGLVAQQLNTRYKEIINKYNLMDIKFIRANTDIVKNNLAVRFKDPTLISHDMHFSLFYIFIT